MAIINAPWQLDETLREPLRALARLLAQEHPAEWKLDWLVDEATAAAAKPARLSPTPRRR
jgi:23S rRNA (adenine2030-N6)-methyltransferase